MPPLRNLSGKDVLKILVNKFGFNISGRRGSHVRISKMTPEGKVGTVVPMHPELKIGTIKDILEQAKVEEEEFCSYI